jgi:hypothetical protein
MNLRRCLPLACAALAPACALAWPTGLASIPIADILGHREALVSYGVFGTEQNVDKRIYHSQGLVVGLFDRLELGYDNDFEGTTELNAKVLLFEDPDEAAWAVSAGVMGFVDGKGSPYIVGRHDFRGFRAHAGMLRQDGDRLMLGFDGEAFGDCVWMLDHTTGPGAMTWAGLDVPINAVPGLWVTGTIGFPHRRSDGIQGSLEVSFGTKF